MEITLSDALKEPTHRVSLGFQILLGLANAGATITLIPVLSVLLPAQVSQVDPLHTANSLAFVLSVGALAALIGNPLAGALSDRTTSRFGRRRPWLVVGSLGVGLGLTLLANSRSVAMLAAGWFIVQFFGNMLLCSYNAILPDRVPVQQRGTTQAIIGLSSPVAVILSDALFARAQNLGGAYVPVIAAQAVLTLLFVLFYQEVRLPKENLSPFRLGPFLASFWVNPRKNRVFARSWLMWFLLWLGYNVGTGSFFFLYVQNITQYEALFPGHLIHEGLALVQALQIAVGVPVMMIAGVVSDRIGRRREFVWSGGALIAAGLLGLACFSSWTMVLVSAVMIGVGFWLFYSLGLAMITQILPSAAERGKDLGVINIASTLPQVFMPFAGAAVITAAGTAQPSGYQALFIFGAAATAVGLIMVGLLRK